MNRVKGKSGIITGGGTGIGRATALLAAREGAEVVVACRTEKTGKETVALIEAEGGDAIFVQTDVTKEEEIENLVKEAMHAYDKIDFLVNNAGMSAFGIPITELTEEKWETIMSVNLKSPLFCMKHVIPEMLKNSGGSIVNVTSATGLVGMPNVSEYCATKGGVNSATRAVAMEYLHQGIRVNVVAPGVIDTPMVDVFTGGNDDMKKEIAQALQPGGRMGKSEEVAPLVLFLMSDESTFCTGACYIVDGGLTCD